MLPAPGVTKLVAAVKKAAPAAAATVVLEVEAIAFGKPKEY